MNRVSLAAAARSVSLSALIGSALLAHSTPATAQTLLDPDLSVTTVISGLSQPIAMAFIGPDDILVTEKASGQVQRITGGVSTGAVLDLAVNSNSERGLLGIALHPNFPTTPYVYLYNTASTTGADTGLVANVPLLGNRVDRFVWNGSTLTFDMNIIQLRAFQNDLNNVADPTLPVLRGNHNGGVLRFGPDGKLYIIIGDEGRRGLTQNNLEGPSPDDAFGGPMPDNAHFTGVIIRLNDDGSIPADNPFYAVGAAVGGEVGANVQRTFGYGVRNSFGMTFDPKTGKLWTTENGGRAFDEVNRVEPGFNGGWIQSMGPAVRVGDYKAIELASGFGANGPAGLQQMRFQATRISDNPLEAVSRMLALPGAVRTDPEFSWMNVVPPAGLGFVDGAGLGAAYDGDLIVGSAVARPANLGHLYRFRLTNARTHFKFEDVRLRDRVADNLALDDFATEGEEIIWGTGFGIVTDIQTGPDGALYLVGPAGSIRKITRP